MQLGNNAVSGGSRLRYVVCAMIDQAAINLITETHTAFAFCCETRRDVRQQRKRDEHIHGVYLFQRKNKVVLCSCSIYKSN